ncbi:MAG: histidinol-phosphatase [Fibrobacter sp.]|nr:histidinol-phosphatase [Fibrobacter sp.]
MLIDYHVHTPYCGHAHGKIVHYIDSAIAAGINEIGFSDHYGRYYLTRSQKARYWDWGMSERDVARYVAELSDLQDVYKDRITIRIGLEIDYVEGGEELLAPLLSNYPLDFYLCSIHCMPRFGWNHLSNYSTRTLDPYSIYKEYFRLARASLTSDVFHSIAHLDFVWRYIPWPSEHHTELLDDIALTIQTAAQADRCIEINANGFIVSQSSLTATDEDPFSFMIDQIAQHNTPVTIGSDAHEPNKVAKAFPELIDYLLSKNITEVYGFTEGRKIPYTLTPVSY